MSFPRLQQGGAAGSCGKVNSDSAYIVAMNSPQVAGGSHCGQYVTVTNTANGKSVRAQVADTCVPLSPFFCPSRGSRRRCLTSRGC